MTSDEVLMQQALNALNGLIEVGAQRGVRPSDITLTIVDALTRRLSARAVGPSQQVPDTGSWNPDVAPVHGPRIS